MATIKGYGSKHSHEFKLTVDETSTSVADNTSEISFSFTLYKASWSWSGWNSITYTITINGEKYTGTIPSYSAGSTLTIKSGTQKITHDDDGKKTISCSFSVNDGSGQTYTCGNASASGDVTLTTIPRTSSVSASSANIEENTIIKINRASENFKHTLTYSFHKLTGTIVEKTSEKEVSWKLPKEFYEQIPNKPSSWITIYCITYNGNTEIGRKECTFTVNTNEEKCKPDISATIVDINPITISLTEDKTKIIKYKSTVQIDINATAKNYSTIDKIKVNNTEISGTSFTIENVETDEFTITVIDSRKYSNEISLKPTVINYIPLSTNATVKRTQPTTGEVSLTFSGNYYNGSFGNIDNQLTMKWFYKESGATKWIKGGNITPVIKDNTYSNGTTAISLGKIFDYQKSYEIYLEITDKLMTSKSQYTVMQGIPIFNWGKDFFNVNGEIRIDNNPINGIVLFESEGISSGSLSLANSISNANKIGILYEDEYGTNGYCEIIAPNEKTISLLTSRNGAVDLIITSMLITISSNSIIINSNKKKTFSSGSYEDTTTKIKKVIGYY